MNSVTGVTHPWDTRPYQSIASAAYDRGRLRVCFADGACVEGPAADVVHDGAEPDWEKLTTTDMEITVPTAGENLEISWLAVRLRTDPAFSAHWDELVAAEDRRIGERLARL